MIYHLKDMYQGLKRVLIVIIGVILPLSIKILIIMTRLQTLKRLKFVCLTLRIVIAAIEVVCTDPSPIKMKRAVDIPFKL